MPLPVDHWISEISTADLLQQRHLITAPQLEFSEFWPSLVQMSVKADCMLLEFGNMWQWDWKTPEFKGYNTLKFFCPQCIFAFTTHTQKKNCKQMHPCDITFLWGFFLVVFLPLINRVMTENLILTPLPPSSIIHHQLRLNTETNQQLKFLSEAMRLFLLSHSSTRRILINAYNRFLDVLGFSSYLNKTYTLWVHL